MSVAYYLLRIFFAACLYLGYVILFPVRAGSCSRVSFVDRIVLAFRLAISRVLLTLSPFSDKTMQELQRKRGRCHAVDDVAAAKKKKDDDYATTSGGVESGIAQKLISAQGAVRRFVAPNSVLYFAGFAASESPAAWSHALKEVATSDRASSASPSRLTDLTIITQSGSSLRGVGSDSIDNVITDTPPATVRRLIAGHLETCVGTLKMLSFQKHPSLEVYNIPLGVMSRLVGLQGEPSNVANAIARTGVATVSNLLHPRLLETTVGVGTFLQSSGALVTQPPTTADGAGAAKQTLRLIQPGTDEHSLVYGMPPINVALLHARFADQRGNVYFSESTLVGDAIAAARAARRNGGSVLVSVQEVRDMPASTSASASAGLLRLDADTVDAISVVDSVLLRDFSGLARHCRLQKQDNNKENKKPLDRDDICELWERASLGYAYATTFHRRWRDCHRDTPVITHAHDEVLRIAKLLTNKKRIPVVRVLVGVSLPELVAMRIAESGAAFLGGDVSEDGLLQKNPFAFAHEERVQERLDREIVEAQDVMTKAAATTTTDREKRPCIQFMVESGVIGGLPAPGFLFGTSFHPHRFMEGPAFWGALACSDFAHMCILGAGEVDVFGNVNVSRASSVVSPRSKQERNGLQEVIGCGGYPDIVDGTSFAIVIVVSVASSGTRFARPHGASIVQRVKEVTFSPVQALQRNAVVRYCTEFGVFHAELCRGGEESRLVAPPGLELAVQDRCKVQLMLDEGDD